nr:H/ACA ribonucleoprotein complex non-core subunit NAF1-like [Aedes albopictus]
MLIGSAIGSEFAQLPTSGAAPWSMEPPPRVPGSGLPGQQPQGPPPPPPGAGLQLSPTGKSMTADLPPGDTPNVSTNYDTTGEPPFHSLSPSSHTRSFDRPSAAPSNSSASQVMMSPSIASIDEIQIAFAPSILRSQAARAERK